MSWRAQGERGSAIGARLLRRLTSWLPRPVARALVPPVALYFLATAPAARLASRRFLARALDRPPTLADQYRQLARFATVLVDRMYLLRDSTATFDVRLDSPASEAVGERYRQCRTGFFMMSAHMGNFEMARILARDLDVPPVHMVMFEENARNFAAVLEAVDPARRLAIIPLGRPDSMLRVHQALDDGGIIGMLPDRLLDGVGTAVGTGTETGTRAAAGTGPATGAGTAAGARAFRGTAPDPERNGDTADSRTLPFLGAPARFPIGPFRMAALMRRPVLLQLGLYVGGNRYRVVIEEIADFSGVDRGERAAAAERALARYVERLEHHARRHPDNWFNFYDYWNEDADGAPVAVAVAPTVRRRRRWKDDGRTT